MKLFVDVDAVCGGGFSFVSKLVSFVSKERREDLGICDCFIRNVYKGLIPVCFVRCPLFRPYSNKRALSLPQKALSNDKIIVAEVLSPRAPAWTRPGVVFFFRSGSSYQGSQRRGRL